MTDELTYNMGLPGSWRGRWLMIAFGILLLAAGGWVYVSSRPGTLIYVLCHDSMGFAECEWLPEFVRYCLPNGLWSLSSILVLHALLRDEPVSRRLAMVSVVPVVGAISELMQAAGWIRGVFDPIDLLCYSLPLIIYYLFQISRNTLTNCKS